MTGHSLPLLLAATLLSGCVQPQVAATKAEAYCTSSDGFAMCASANAWVPFPAGPCRTEKLHNGWRRESCLTMEVRYFRVDPTPTLKPYDNGQHKPHVAPETMTWQDDHGLCIVVAWGPPVKCKMPKPGRTPR